MKYKLTFYGKYDIISGVVITTESMLQVVKNKFTKEEVIEFNDQLIRSKDYYRLTIEKVSNNDNDYWR